MVFEVILIYDVESEVDGKSIIMEDYDGSELLMRWKGG